MNGRGRGLFIIGKITLMVIIFYFWLKCIFGSSILKVNEIFWSPTNFDDMSPSLMTWL
jgi:hypothetical protein